MKHSLFKAFIQTLALSAVSAGNINSFTMVPTTGESALIPHNTTDGPTFSSDFTQTEIQPCNTKPNKKTTQTNDKNRNFGNLCAFSSAIVMISMACIAGKYKQNKLESKVKKRLQMIEAAISGNFPVVKRLLKTHDCDNTRRHALMRALTRVNPSLNPANYSYDLKIPAVHPAKDPALYKQYSKIIIHLFNSFSEDQMIHLFTSNDKDQILQAINEFLTGDHLSGKQYKDLNLAIKQFKLYNEYEYCVYKMLKALNTDPNQKSILGSATDVLSLVTYYLQPEGAQNNPAETVKLAQRRLLTFSGPTTGTQSQQTQQAGAPSLKSAPVTAVVPR
jgi:hypothetical protein